MRIAPGTHVQRPADRRVTIGQGVDAIGVLLAAALVPLVASGATLQPFAGVVGSVGDGWIAEEPPL